MIRYLAIVFLLVVSTSSVMASTNKYDIAHVKEGGQDMIIIPVSDRFGFQSPRIQEQFYTDMEVCAKSTGLSGTVVLMTENRRGQTNFYGPKEWGSFFKHWDITMNWVRARINYELTCK
jgi:hypothetical protein